MKKELVYFADAVDVVRPLELGVSAVMAVILFFWMCSRTVSLPTMPDDLREIAGLFRATAVQLRRLSMGPIRTKSDIVVAIEGYLNEGQIRTAPAFPPDQCKETANLLEEFAAKLEAICVRSRSGT